MNELLSIGVPFNNSTFLPKRAIESRRKFRRVTHYRYLEKNETNVVIIFIYAFIKNIKYEIKGQKLKKKTKQSNIYDSAASCFLNVLNRYFYFFRKPVTFVILRFYQNCVLCILWEFGCLFIASISLMNIWEKCQHINKISVASWKWDKEYKNPVEIYDASRISNEAFHLNLKLESWWKTNHYGFWITNTNHWRILIFSNWRSNLNSAGEKEKAFYRKRL